MTSRPHSATIVLALLAPLVPACRSAPDLALQPIDPGALRAEVATAAGRSVTLRVVGFPAGFGDRLAGATDVVGSALRVVPDGLAVAAAELPPTVGTTVLVHDGLEFRPRYALQPGQRYRISVDLAALERRLGGAGELGSIELTAEIAATGAPSARVEAIYPSAATLPENQLKFYVEFSLPMRRWDPLEHVRLLDAETGEEQAAVFYMVPDGLWDPAGTRLTVIMDPGRVKRGLRNHEAFGPPLRQGSSFRLVIDASFPDAAGRPLGQDFEKTFRVVAADRARPDPERWRVTSPAPGTRQPLRLDFDEAMDHALLLGGVEVRGADGRPIRGQASAVDAEAAWQLAPDEPWQPGPHVIVVDARLEDLAGNNLSRLFDTDLQSAPRPAASGGAVELPFDIGDS